MKTRAQADRDTEAAIKRTRVAIKGLQNQLKGYPSGSREAKDVQQQIDQYEASIDRLQSSL